MIGKHIKKIFTTGLGLILFLIIYTIVAMYLNATSSWKMAYSGTQDIGFADGWTDDAGNEIDLSSLDSLASSHQTNTFVLYHRIPKLQRDSYLSFYTYGTFFSVDIGDETVYTYEYKPIFTAGHSYGTDFHNILVPQEDAGELITLRIEMIYGSGGSFLDMSLGKSSDFVIRFLRHELPAFIISLMVIIFGIIIIGMSKAVSEDKKILKSLRSFAALSIAIGIWSMIESQVLTLIYGQAEFFRSYDYLLLMLLPYPMVSMANGWVEYSSERFERIVKALVAGDLLLTLLLRIFFNLDLHQLDWMIHIVLLFSFIGCICLICRNILFREKHLFHQRLRLWTGLAVLSYCAVLDLIRYSKADKSNIDAARFTRIGFLFLMYFFLSQYMVESKERLRKSIEAETFRQMAYRDGLTGVGSRAAFEAKEKELNLALREKKMTIVFVSIDLNHLKKVNDTYGHATGDNYILACTELIREAFDDHGSIYRIGGDEFAIFIEGDMAKQIYESRYRRLMQLLDTKAKDFPVQPSFAIGYEILTSDDGRDVESAEKVADAKMYEHKMSMKAGRVE